MNRLLLKLKKSFFSLPLLAFCILFIAFGEVYSQGAVTISAASGGLAPSPLIGGTANIAVFGVQLTKAGGAMNTVTAITFGMTSDPNGKFINPRLYESADATFSGVGIETFIATGTLNPTNISFSGSPLTGFDGANGGDDEFFFLVVDVDPTVTVGTTAIQPSLTGGNVTVSMLPGTASGGPVTGTNYSFTAPVTTIANLSTGIAPSPLIAGSTGRGVFGFSLTSTGGQTVSGINIQITNGSPSSKWVTASYALITSTDADFSTTGDNSAPISGLTFTPSATEIAITGLTQSITSIAKNYFLVATIDPSVTGATTTIQPSLGAANVMGTGTFAGTATGTNFSFAAAQTTIANLSTGLATSPLQAGATGQGVFGFSLTSTGSQTVSVINIQVTSTAVSKWGSYSLITSTDNSFATTGDNSTPIAGLTFNATSGTQIAITGLSQNITTAGTNYFLVVNVDPAVNGSTSTIQPSLGLTNITVGTGTVAGSASGTTYSFAPLLTIATLSTGVAASPLVASTINQGVFGFSLTSSGSQTVTIINIQVTSTPVSKWGNYRLITSTDNSYATTGDNSTPIAGLAFAPSASQIAITGLSQVITTGTNYFLVVDIDPGVTGATTAIQPTLGAGNITITTGGGIATGTATGTNYSFGLPTASFGEISAGTAPVILGTVLSAGSTLQVLTGFSATSNSSQTITRINFNYTGLAGQLGPNEYLYRSGTAGSIGSVVQTDNTPEGDFTGLSEAINATPVYFYLVVDVENSVTSATASLTAALTQADITVAGNKNALSISRVFTFNTSQLSDITLNGGTTDDILYISNRTGNPLTSGNSVSLATFRIRDGAGATDGDNKGTILTSLQIQIPANHTMLRRIAIFDGSSLVSGTQTDVTVSTITFSGLTLTASDGGTKDFTIRATFQNTVTDNARINVTITSASASGTGSGFASGNAGGATTTGVAAPANQIEVIATALVLTGNPTSSPLATNFPLSLQARDAQNNVDLDYGGYVELTATGGGGTLSVQAGESLTPTFTGGIYNWSTLRVSQSGSYTLTASDDNIGAGGNDQFTDPTANITITSSPSTITQGTTTPATICYGNTVAGPIPTAYFPLSNIVITETDAGGISGSNGTYTFSAALPSGFVFDQSVTSGLAVGGGSDLSSPSAYTYPASNIVQFSFSLSGSSNTNSITISGLRVGHTHPGDSVPPPTGALNVTRSGGSASIAGVTTGTVLGTVSASQQGAGTASFTVAAVSGDPIDPNTTSFNSNANPIKLVPNPSTGNILFTGSGGGITFVSGEYRFNPSSLSPGTYTITYTHTTNTPGCQTIAKKDFIIFTSGINNLDPSYCSNSPISGIFSVDQTFLNSVYGTNNGTWSVDNYVYYDPPAPYGGGTGWKKITTPSNTRFDPSLLVYQNSVQWFKTIGYPQGMAVGIAVCNPAQGVLCDGNSTYGQWNAYQFVDIRAAPSPTFTLPSNIYTYCDDNAPITLTGSPANSTDAAVDFFTASGGQGASISHSLVSGNREWVFSPASVTGVTPSVSQTFNISYQFRDPVTACSSTFSRSITVHDRPPIVPSGNITKTPDGEVSNLTVQLCQGAPIGTFTATDNTYTYRWYADPAAPANLLRTGLNFTPPVDNLVPGTTPFHVTRERNGCESINTPLALSAVVIAAPAAPVPNFTDATREYCVGASINPTHLGVPGTNLKWYNSAGVVPILITPIANPNQPTTAELSISTASAANYSFSVTQTTNANSCEGPPTKITVKVLSLPVISIAPTTPDPLRICTTGGNIKFTPTDQGNPAPGTNWTVDGAPSPGPGVLTNFNTDGTVELNPLTGMPGNYVLRYTYSNSAGCSNSGTRNITILPTITPNVSIGPVCDGSPAIINNTSTVNPGTSMPATAGWVFGDGASISEGTYTDNVPPNPANPGKTSGTYQNPTHIYPSVGTFQISGTMVTSDGCRYAIPQQPVIVSPLPIANFISQNVCVNSPTNFLASANISIQNYSWNFARNGNLNPGTSSGASNTASFTYTVTGKDSVRLIATTSAGCQDIVDKPIFIVPVYTPITATSSYTQDFTINDGWIAGGVNSSWALGTPNGTKIIGDATSPFTGTAWATNLTDNYKAGEKSWVLSGCFNFSGALKPVIAIDIWSDGTDADGAVIQYNTNGNIEDRVDPLDPDGEWIRLGNVGDGINWYDESGISGNPGNQTTISAGWTGRYPKWRKAIVKLDPLIGAQRVVFRVAFTGSTNPRGDGFAFDNISVAERNRIVLMESFTNTSTEANSKTHNDFFGAFGTAAELVKIQYHTPFPGKDTLNAMFPQVNNARTAFYGITSSPILRIDGVSAGAQNPAAQALTQAQYDQRILVTSPLKINVTVIKDPGSAFVRINTTITNSTGETLPTTGLRVFTTLVEKKIIAPSLRGSYNDTLRFVAKAMLPTPTGIKINKDLASNETYNVPEIIWDDRNLFTSGNGGIVIHVQSIEGGDKNVFQSYFYNNPPEPDLITSIEDPTFADKIMIYPNPANHELNVVLPRQVTTQTPLQLMDTQGRIVYDGNFNAGESRKTISTTEFAGGMYILQIRAKENVARKKVMIVHGGN